MLACSCKTSIPDSHSHAVHDLSKVKVDLWLTDYSNSIFLYKQNKDIFFGGSTNTYPTIEVDEDVVYQEVDGFGFTLTGGSVQAINMLDSNKKAELLKELFGKNNNSISVSYLRLSIGASDLNTSPFTYNDLPPGQVDYEMQNFNFGEDANSVIPFLQEVIAINPDLKLIATPWSAPTWMKTNNHFVGGSLKPEFYEAYAKYFVKYILKMQEKGLVINAVTPQNEPLHPGNNPSMYMSAPEQAKFIKDYLGPALAEAKLKTKIIIYDHNCDKPGYPLTILNDSDVYSYVDGTAFHLYAGNISALSAVHAAFPDKNLYFTEQYTSSKGAFQEDFSWHIKNVIIGSMRNWSKTAMEWNLANDPNFMPFTEGGCSTCKGGITVNDSNSFERNVGYYIIGHISKFVFSGSHRILSNQLQDLNNVAFRTPEGKIILIVQNDGDSMQIFNIKNKDKLAAVSLAAGAVATLTW